MVAESKNRSGTRLMSTAPGGHISRLPVYAFGLALSLFLVISYVLCVLGYLLFPQLPVMHMALSIFLPGFELLTWPSFFLGLIESFGWGWYIALIFGPLYNFFVNRM